MSDRIKELVQAVPFDLVYIPESHVRRVEEIGEDLVGARQEDEAIGAVVQFLFLNPHLLARHRLEIWNLPVEQRYGLVRLPDELANNRCEIRPLDHNSGLGREIAMYHLDQEQEFGEFARLMHEIAPEQRELVGFIRYISYAILFSDAGSKAISQLYLTPEIKKLVEESNKYLLEAERAIKSNSKLKPSTNKKLYRLLDKLKGLMTDRTKLLIDELKVEVDAQWRQVRVRYARNQRANQRLAKGQILVKPRRTTDFQSINMKHPKFTNLLLKAAIIGVVVDLGVRGASVAVAEDKWKEGVVQGAGLGGGVAGGLFSRWISTFVPHPIAKAALLFFGIVGGEFAGSGAGEWAAERLWEKE